MSTAMAILAQINSVRMTAVTAEQRPSIRLSTVESASNGLSQTYTVICQRKHLDSGAPGPLHLVNGSLDYLRCISPTVTKALDQRVLS